MLRSSPGTHLPPQLKEGQGLGRERPPSQKEVGGSLPVGKIVYNSETNNQTDIFEQNSDIFEQNSNTEPESLLKIKCEADLDKPRQIIAPIIAINPKSKNGYSFVHEVSMVLTRPNSRGIKEHFSHENEK